MTQQTSPFLEGKFGWTLGESNWNLGMDENLLKFSYMFDRNIDGIVSSLPAPVNGQAYFNTTDNRIYYAVNGVFSSTPVPKWFEVKEKTTGHVYQFDGASLIAVVKQPFMGSVVRTQAEKNFETVTPQDAGAIGNGVVDDTAAFVAAQLASDRVLVPDGVYLVDGTQLNLDILYGSPNAVLLYKTGQRVSLTNVGNAESLDQLYWQEVQAAPGTTLSLNTTHQGIGICEDVLYMAQNVSFPSGIWASDSVVRVASFPITRAGSDAVDITVTGGTAPTAVADLIGLGHGAGASIIREGGKLWLYSTVSAPVGQAPIDGVNCNYGTGYTKTEWKGAATVSGDVQSFRGLKGVFNAEVCVSAGGRYVVMVGHRFLPVIRDTANYYSAIPHVSVFDRLEVEAAADPTTVNPLQSFPVPFVQGAGDAVGGLAGVACDGEYVYILNSGAQVVGGRSVLVMTLSGELVKALPVSGWAGVQPELFRKGAGGKVAVAYEMEGLAFLDDKLMLMSKFNVCTPSTVVDFQGKNFIPVGASTGVSPVNFGSWARTEAPSLGPWNELTAYTAPTGLIYHKYLTALAPKGRYERPHSVADGLYPDCQTAGYAGGYAADAGYNVSNHFMVGQFDRNTDTSWPMFEYRGSGLGRLFDCDQIKTGTYDPTSFFGRISYDYDVGTLLSGGPSVGTGATITLTNSRDTTTGDRYVVIHSQGTRALLCGVTNISYKSLVPTTNNTLSNGSAASQWADVRSVLGTFTGAVQLGQFTLATLPSAATFNGRLIDVTNATGGPKVCRSNGTVWQILNTTTTVS